MPESNAASLDKVYTIQLTGHQIEQVYSGLRDIADETLRNPKVYTDSRVPDPQDVIDLVNLAITNREIALSIESQYLNQHN